MTLTAYAPAKINLYLDVTGICDNGYHSIKSVMQTVDLYDVITVNPTTDEIGGITLSCSDPAVPLGTKNIAYKAADAFFRNAKTDVYGCRIHIEKHIPMEAGLAGGSTDAAAVLRLLNEIHGNPLTVDELCRIGATIGADVPFCIKGGTVLCEGIGEQLSPLPSLPYCYIVIARGGEGVSTPDGYRLVDERHCRDFSGSRGDFAKLSKALESGDIDITAKHMYNIFEDVILPHHSVAPRLREIMLECGASGAIMSGSGPSVFGIFTSKDAADMAMSKAEKISRAFLCHPVDL